MADAIQIRAPFGNLSVPYSAIRRVTRDMNGGIGLDLSGATVRLDCSRVPDMLLNALVEVVERGQRVPSEQRPHPVERDLDPPQVGWMVNLLGAAL
ncbi:MAG: hypothetical protein ABSB57_05710, partial [Dehalococcoidia bacterium]